MLGLKINHVSKRGYWWFFWVISCVLLSSFTGSGVVVCDYDFNEVLFVGDTWSNSQRLFYINTWWRSNATWCHIFVPSLVQVMACRLFRLYLNQYWFIVIWNFNNYKISTKSILIMMSVKWWPFCSALNMLVGFNPSVPRVSMCNMCVQVWISHCPGPPRQTHEFTSWQLW